MADPLSFKHMIPTGMLEIFGDELIAYRRLRHRKTNCESVETAEALTTQQRLARKRLMRKLAPKIKIGRERAKRRMPDMKRFQKRAEKAARLTILKKFTKGVDKNDLSFAKRAEIEKRLDKPAVKAQIQRLKKRLIKDVRKKEMERRKQK